MSKIILKKLVINTNFQFLFYIGYVFLFFPLLLGPIYIPISSSLFIIYLFICYNKLKKLSRFNIIVSSGLLLLLLQSITFFNLELFIYSILPTVLLALFYLFKASTLNYFNFIKTFKLLSLFTSIICIFQFIFEPSLFGIVNTKSANLDTHGTSSFRVSGFFGSPQNCALLFGSSLFLNLRNKLLNIISNITIISSGILTLSTFFGLSLVIFIITRNKYLLTASLFFLPAVISFDFRNTILESFSFVEATGLIDRYSHQEYSLSTTQLFLGNGLGHASQGLLDRGYIRENTLESESSFEVFFFERGLLFSLVFLFIFFRKIVNVFMNHEFGYFLFLFIILLNFFLVPAFSSFKAALIYLPFIFIRFNYVRIV